MNFLSNDLNEFNSVTGFVPPQGEKRVQSREEFLDRCFRANIVSKNNNLDTSDIGEQIHNGVKLRESEEETDSDEERTLKKVDPREAMLQNIFSAQQKRTNNNGSFPKKESLLRLPDISYFNLKNLDTSSIHTFFNNYRKQKPQKEETSVFNKTVKESADQIFYDDVSCLDKNRVILQSGLFCHANRVKIGNQAYILSQAPAPNSEKHQQAFFEMILSTDTETIVKLTKNEDARGKKSADYIPHYGEEKKFGPYTLKQKEPPQIFEDFTIHTLLLKTKSQKKEIRVLDYTGWPDCGVPNKTDAFEEMVKQTEKLGNKNNKPVVVHCSAGIGRTGTFIAYQLIKEKIRLFKDCYPEKSLLAFTLDMDSLIKEVRYIRAHAVQTSEQILFLYKLAQKLIQEELS